MKTREEAFSLLNEYTKSESLLKHSLAVEAAMLWYARFYKQDTEEQLRWGICGLLHDFDYEKYPSTEDHPYKGNQILKELNYSDDICNAIMGHATY
ncbi:MAG: HDIG domain-containing protein, partial [Bdellovibrionales bacterium]|nr:HDIG domain-containing protein [Bdellovibrionales bacterium]